jgi:hypothetical protein
MALRVRDYKLAFQLQEAFTTNVWADPFVKLRVPHIFNLRRDPFERADFVGHSSRTLPLPRPGGSEKADR